MLQKTALYDKHLAANAKMVEFAGFSLPINYGSQLKEHNTVRKQSGMFDVSHMMVSDITGPDSKKFLEYLLANDVSKLKDEGKALYSCMLNENGGILDDVIVYWLQNDKFRIVSNGATKDRDLAWMRKIIQNFAANLSERSELSILAVQGPKARDIALKILPEDINAQSLGRFYGSEQNNIFVGRTGYTGEDGFEIIAGNDDINQIWDELLASGATPCGLGARDSLRLEAGMMLYGTDMDETTNPFESGLKWTVSMNQRDFIGKVALETALAGGVDKKMVGLVLEDKGIMRRSQEVFFNDKITGEVTSGGFSPLINKSIAFARVEKDVVGSCTVKIRDKFLTASVGGLDFIKRA